MISPIPLLKKEIPLDEIAGRTVEAHAFADDECRLLLTFTDGTFILLRAAREWDENKIEPEDFDLSDYDREIDVLVTLGIVDEAAVEAERAEKQAEAEAARAREAARLAMREWNESQRLAAKYGGK